MKTLKRLKNHLIGKKAKTIQQVAIFGYSDCKETDPLYREVLKVSKELAEAGYTVVDGGGPGVMKAATVGARLGGGKVIGVTLYPKDMTNFEGRDLTNFVDKEIKTNSYVERTLALMRTGQVYIIFNGGTGTISEFAMAWGLARLYFGHHKPLILYGEFWTEIIKSFRDNMKLRDDDLRVFKICTTPDGVLRAIKSFEKSKHKHIRPSGDFAHYAN